MFEHVVEVSSIPRAREPQEHGPETTIAPNAGVTGRLTTPLDGF